MAIALYGNAVITATGDGTVLRLTSADVNQAGSAFLNYTSTNLTFSTEFAFRMTDPGGLFTDALGGVGADGIVFVVKPTSAPNLGDIGIGMGYLGLSQNSIGVEFDTWYNGEIGDISSNHVGIDQSYTRISPQLDVTADFNDG